MTPALALRQQTMFDSCPITAAVEALAHAGGAEERGAVFTKREVVDFILDLCGYTVDQRLFEKRLLEPSFGAGDFLIPAIERLLSSCRANGFQGDEFTALGPCIRAVELHRETFRQTHAAVVAQLEARGLAPRVARALADQWLVFGDYLLADLPGPFDLVVGNPPYVRQELIPAVLMAEYRSRYLTIYDRADLYIPFIECSLSSLAPGGMLGFICADRWMKNRYGGPLRSFVASRFHLRAYIDMSDTPAFHTDVIAYPAVTIIAREPPGETRVAHRPEISARALSDLAKVLTAKAVPSGNAAVRSLACVTAGSEPWILDNSDQMAVLRRLERDFPPLEEAGCKVGIGVATGADKAFIGPYEALDVEEDRKLPLVMTRDIQTGHVSWRGYGVVNPFVDGPGSGLVDLDDYPRLKRFLEARKGEIARRHCAKKTPAHWYRTIDRITASLAGKPKLLIPDIKGQAQIVFEAGNFYPHHNLYFVTSDEWDLRALQAVLLSSVARLFIASYSTKMRGGFLRFQAQYLRRIRVPHWKDVPDKLRQELKSAAESLDLSACNQAAGRLYGLNHRDLAALGGGGANDGA